jgi:hypothetical protein
MNAANATTGIFSGRRYPTGSRPGAAHGVRADYEAIETRVGHLMFHQSPAAAAVTLATSTNESENVGALP